MNNQKKSALDLLSRDPQFAPFVKELRHTSTFYVAASGASDQYDREWAIAILLAKAFETGRDSAFSGTNKIKTESDRD